MLHRVFGFGDLTAGQVMLPRTEMIALPVHVSRKDLLERLSRATQLVIPVYGAHLDDILGLVRMRDLLDVVAGSAESIDLTSMLHEPLTVPETLKADDLLTDMRKRRTPLAIVIDEYGGTAGLVTFERLMERIVGENRIRRRQRHVGHHGTHRRLRAHRRPGAHDGRERAVRPRHRRRPLRYNRRLCTRAAGAAPRLGDVVEVGGRKIRVEALDGLRVARVLLSTPS